MKRSKKAILGMLGAIIVSFSILNVSVEPQEWAAISYYCGEQSESTLGKTIGHTAAYTLSGAAGAVIGAGIAAGGVPGVVAGVVWGAYVLG